jgi:hypothetical protein
MVLLPPLPLLLIFNIKKKEKMEQMADNRASGRREESSVKKETEIYDL